MIKPGLVSVTFRQLSAEELVALAAQANLQGIEWGGDIHVHPDNISRAREVRQITRDAGLEVASYGSYYRLGHSDPAEFSPVLDAAVALGAPVIRVWPGRKASADADVQYRANVVADSRRIADMAAKAGIAIMYEWHMRSLTDSNESGAQLLNEVAHENVWTSWQPLVQESLPYNLEGLRAILDKLYHLHVFHWAANGEQLERRALADGANNWREYFAAVNTTGRTHFALLEFVADDSPENFLRDAQTLLSLLENSS